ncbi:LamG domain-containing protein [Hymenobacter puniceus]|uniref:LamG domain-containing protein n=1 Tax=Hymenobacter sp. BT190 TaxID=2763505 RepID=UPI001650EF90|nr:LamG domain-containing protein [Hymenobacter sp. BT190]MBC6700263.1 LamG domain-containing protein [Hymenobacter sp. BT190]
MKKILLLLLVAWLSYASAFGQNDTTDFGPAPYRLSFQSFEAPIVDGQLTVALSITANQTITSNDWRSITDNKSFFAFDASEANRSTALTAGATQTNNLYLTYDRRRLPFYPVEVKVMMEHTDEAGKVQQYNRACYVYFTPYNTVEVWDQLDYKKLRRMWLTDDGRTFENRQSVAQQDIPVSDIPQGYQASAGEVFDMEYVEGLAYAIPMRNTSFTGYNTDTLAGPQYRDDCGIGYRRYKGRLVDERLFTWHLPDNKPLNVRLPIRRARVEVWQYHSAAPDQHIRTYYTDEQGYISSGNSSSVQFEKCSSNSKDIRVYLKIMMTDGGENVRVKESWAFDRFVTTVTPLRTINYNSDQSIITQITFGQPAAVGHDVELSEPQAGKVYTWAKISWDYTQAALTNTGKSLSHDLKIVLVDGERGVYRDENRNIELGAISRASEFVVMHEFGHFVQHELQNSLPSAQGDSEHSGQYNNNHHLRTLKEGFANGFAYIMDEMTFRALDQEAGSGYLAGNYHEQINFGSSTFRNLTHPFVSEQSFGNTLLDLWDGPNNFALYNNPGGPGVYQDPADPMTGYVEQYEMSFARLLRPFINRIRYSVTEYYNALLGDNNTSFAENQNIRNLWYYNFNLSTAPINSASFRILNTDEIAPLATVQTPYFTGNFPGTLAGNHTHTYDGTDTGQLNGSGSSYNVTTYVREEYDTSGRLIGVETINANGVTLSDPVMVTNGAALLLHGSPRPRWYNGTMPSLVRYTKRNDHLNIDLRDLARVTVGQGSQMEIGSTSPYQTAGVNLFQGTYLTVEAGATVRVHAGSTLNIWENGTLLVRNGGTLLVDGDLFIRWGGHICVEEGGNVTLTGSSTLYVDNGARMGVMAGVGLPTGLTCTNKVAACGIVNIQNSGVVNIGGGNEALSFDGNDVVTIPNTGSYVNGLGQQFAIEAYIRPVNPQMGGGQTILSNRRSNPAKTYGLEGALLTLIDGYLLLQLEGVNFGYGQASMRIPTDGACHHVGVSRDGTNRLRFFIDGQAVAYSPSTSRSPNAGGALSLGASDPYGSGFSEYYTGMLGEVRVWNSSRTDDQIRQNFTSKLAAPQFGLVVYYDFQDATGQQVGDGAGGATGHGMPLVPGVLGTSNVEGADDPSWLSKCSLPCAVQGNFRITGANMTTKSGDFSRGSVADTMGQSRSAMSLGLTKKGISHLASLHVTPNPASNTATLHFAQPSAGLVRVRILDLSGNQRAEALPKTRLEAGRHTVSLPLRGLLPGLYLITVESPTGQEFIRLQVE